MQKQPNNFLQEAEDIFKNHLSSTRIMIKDKQSGKILEDISYKNVMFDSNMNFYKIVNDEVRRVDNDNFEVVVIRDGKEI